MKYKTFTLSYKFIALIFASFISPPPPHKALQIKSRPYSLRVYSFREIQIIRIEICHGTQVFQ